jgi:hypothetical protein
MNEANIKRLVSKLSQMRGAALKLGQFLSIQGKPRMARYNTFSDVFCRHAFVTARRGCDFSEGPRWCSLHA